MKAKKTKKNPKGKSVLKTLTFTLNDQEKSERGLKAADLNHEIQQVTIEKKMVTDEFSAKLKDLSATRNELLKQIKDGTEDRQVNATLVKNYKDKKMEYWFNGTLMESNTMTANDLQDEFQFGKGKKKPKQPKDDKTKGKVYKMRPVDTTNALPATV